MSSSTGTGHSATKQRRCDRREPERTGYMPPDGISASRAQQTYGRGIGGVLSVASHPTTEEVHTCQWTP
jgi:hypothetical protein